MRVRPIHAVVMVVLCLATTACDSAARGTGVLGENPSVAPSVPTGPPTGPGATGPSATSPVPSTGTETTGTHGGGSGGGSGSTGSGGSTTGGPPVVSVQITDQQSVTTSECPYRFTFHATISVTDGPVDVGYTWRSSQGGGGLVPHGTVHFGKRGPQSVTVSTSVVAAAVYTQMGEWIELDGISTEHMHNTTMFNLTCSPSATVPAARVARATCPYTTTFDATISTTVGPLTVTVVWLVNGVGARVDTIVFSGVGTQSQTISLPTTVPQMDFFERWPVSLRVTTPAGIDFVTKAGTASCDQVNHT